MSESAGRHEPSDSGEWARPWAHDAQRLFTVLREVADRAASGAREPGPGQTGDDAAGQHAHATAAECTYCPICSGMAMVRRSGPEMLDKIAEFAAGLAATWRAADRDRPAPWETSVPDDPPVADEPGVPGTASFMGDAPVPKNATFRAGAVRSDDDGPQIPPIRRINITD